MRPDLTARLRSVFAEALGIDVTADVTALRYREIPAWDSVGHMALVAAIEDEFDIQLDTEQVIDLNSFTAAVDIVVAAALVR
jgi:acyl carrier protein